MVWVLCWLMSWGCKGIVVRFIVLNVFWSWWLVENDLFIIFNKIMRLKVKILEFKKLRIIIILWLGFVGVIGSVVCEICCVIGLNDCCLVIISDCCDFLRRLFSKWCFVFICFLRIVNWDIVDFFVRLICLKVLIFFNSEVICECVIERLLLSVVMLCVILVLILCERFVSFEFKVIKLGWWDFNFVEYFVCFCLRVVCCFWRFVMIWEFIVLLIVLVFFLCLINVVIFCWWVLYFVKFVWVSVNWWVSFFSCMFVVVFWLVNVRWCCFLKVLIVVFVCLSCVCVWISFFLS